MRYVAFLPAAIAALTDGFVTLFVRSLPQDYPDRVIILQAVMFAAALMVVPRQRWVRVAAFALLIAGVLISSFSVGMFYVPTLIAATWSVSKRPPLG
jgi:hypothetical protein